MASLRKASAYSKKPARPYTRKSGKQKKSYIKAVPPSKIVKFVMGNQQDYENNKHKFAVRVVSEEKIQIRDNSLEASRMVINKIMENEASGLYFLRVMVFPHHVLRENKTAAGAGADRLSSGMKHSFGVTVGRAALVPNGKDIFYASCLNEKAAQTAKKAMNVVKSKLPGKVRIVYEKLE